MAEYKQKINIRTGQFNLVPTNTVIDFKEGVATQGDLPLSGNTKGDARIANDTGHLYVWSIVSPTGLLTDWVDEGDIIDLEWTAILGKPSSTPANIDDAVSKKHTQNSDTKLDEGNPNEVTAANAKDAVDKKHEHTNKATLDAIQEALTTALKNAYDGAVTDSHTHSNKATLDSIEEAFTTALKAAYDSCVTNEHTHTNKATLDNIQEAFTTALKNAYDSCVTNEHTHANKATLDSIEEALTSVLKTAYDDAVTKAHEHSNKTELDKVTIGDHDVDTGNPHSAVASDIPTDASGVDVQANLDDLNTKSHTQGTDQKLDDGGVNEVSAAQVKSAVDDDHTHANKSTLDGTQEEFTTILKNKLDDIVNPLLFKGEINLAADFPTSATVQNGWTYRIASDVTDNDPSKTNTGQSFLTDAEIAWNGTDWTELGYSTVKSVNGETGIVTLIASDIPTDDSGVDVQAALDALEVDQHVQGTDQKLDDGGANEVTVADVKDAVDKKHTQGTDLGLDNGGSNPITAEEITDLETREKYADSPMLVTGGLLAEGTNAGTFKVTAITSALLRTSASDIGELAEVTLAEQDNQAITLANTKYYVILTYGTPCTISISTSNANGQNAIGIGIVMKDGSDNVHFCNCGMRLQNGVAKLHRRAATLRASELASGSTIAYQAIREFTMTEGIVYEGINRYNVSSFDSAVGKFTYCYRDTDVWQYTADSTVIDDDYYDNNTAGKGAIGVTKYGCHWVYMHPSDEDVYVVYGRGNYSLAEAEAAQPPADLPNIISEFGLLIGKIIIQKDATSFAEVQMVTDTFFTGTGVADHNQLGSLQGGAAGEYYHMTSVEETAATRDATNAQNGLMPTGVKDGYDAAASASHTQDTDIKIIVGDTEVSIADTGADGTISMKADNVVEATVTKDGFKLKAGADINEISIDGTLAGNSDDAVPTEKAVKTYVDANAGGVNPSSVIAVFERSASVTTGDGKADLVIPSTLNGMNLVRAQAVVITAGTTNATTVAIYNVTDSSEMLSGNISIASGDTVGTPGTIDTGEDDVVTNDVLRIDVDAVSTTAPLGLLVVLEFATP